MRSVTSSTLFMASYTLPYRGNLREQWSRKCSKQKMLEAENAQNNICCLSTSEAIFEVRKSLGNDLIKIKLTYGSPCTTLYSFHLDYFINQSIMTTQTHKTSYSQAMPWWNKIKQWNQPLNLSWNLPYSTKCWW